MHPGGALNTILQSACKVSVGLTHKDLIYVCGGTNDFNDETEGPNVEDIIKFIQSNKHTNIIVANVPPRYDLSYYSQINEKIRTYNRKIAEIIREHEEVTLMEMDTKRKNHTRKGFHFNKSGKWWLSHKITTSIKAILNLRTEQSTNKETNHATQENLDVVKEGKSTQRSMDDIKVNGKLATLIEKTNTDTELLAQNSKEKLYVNNGNKLMDDKDNQNSANVPRINGSASVDSVNKLIDVKGNLNLPSVVELNQEDSVLKVREDMQINEDQDKEQDSPLSTQSHSLDTVDRIDETRRTSTR